MSGWKAPTEVKLLSGDNPQVPKGDGDAPVRYYIDNMPGWKRDLGERIDQLIADTMPDVYRKVRWPPKSSKHPDVRYLDILEHDDLDEAQLTAWLAQAIDLPGERI
jgi:hypothetical protein